MNKDRYGNPLDPVVGYARGRILKSSLEEALKQKQAYWLINNRINKLGVKSLYNFTGLDKTFPLEPNDVGLLLDEHLGPPQFEERLKALSREHMGGKADDDAAYFNRATAAIIATELALVKEGDTVVSVVPGQHSHPSIPRGALLAGAKFVEVTNAMDLKAILEQESTVSLVIITGVTMQFDIFSLEELEQIIRIAKDRRITTFIDDAYGSRLRVVLRNQPKTLALGVDIGLTSFGKAGLKGPRAGLLVGKADKIKQISSKALELGLEARGQLALSMLRSLERYDQRHCLEDVEIGEEIYRLAKELYGNKVQKTLVGIYISLDDVLKIVLEKTSINKTAVVPAEASCSLAMILLNDYGIITIPAVGSPGATLSLRLKPFSAEVKRFGGSRRSLEAVDESFNTLTKVITDLSSIKKIILGDH